MNLTEFTHVFREAAAWCFPLLSAPWTDDSLRSKELLSKQYDESIDSDTIQQVVSRRSELLGRSPLTDVSADPQMVGTRILICDFASSDASEASAFDSDGYFDAFDVPPWDTWITFMRNPNSPRPWMECLISLVPLKCVDRVQSGINSNPCDVLYWASPVYNDSDSLNHKLDWSIPKWLSELTPGLRAT